MSGLLHARIREFSQVPETPSQLDKFKEAARELKTDDDPKRFKERLAKLVKHKPPTKDG